MIWDITIPAPRGDGREIVPSHIFIPLKMGWFPPEKPI